MNYELLISSDLLALGQRAVVCKGWRWLAGVQFISVREAPLKPVYGRCDRTDWDIRAPRYQPYPNAVPCFDDPSTLGCLVHLVRYAWLSPYAYARNTGVPRESDQKIGWEMCDLELKNENVRFCGYASEVEALVAALEAAP